MPGYGLRNIQNTVLVKGELPAMYEVIDKYLKSFREIAHLTTENGWVDNATLKFEILEQDEKKALVELNFEEIVMSASGCTINRVECWGKVELQLEGQKVVGVTIL